MTEVGTLAWARRTDGRLSGRDLAEVLAQAVRSQSALLPQRAAAALGLRKDRLARVDVRDIAIPDTPLARSAVEAAEVMSPPLVAHSHRTYLWGMVLAGHDGMSPDPELLYVASLLHDAGLPQAVSRGTDRCFTLDSAEMAEGIGAPAAVAEAITLHLNPEVERERGPEARMLNAGAALDVVGMRRWEVHPDTIWAVHDRHPRGDFLGALHPLFRAHAAAAPRCRVHALYRFGAFGPMTKLAWR